MVLVVSTQLNSPPLPSCVQMGLEEAMGYVQADELIEVRGFQCGT